LRSDTKRRLERAGWRVSDTTEFLGLHAQEQRLIELKLALAAGIRQWRERRGLSQAALAKHLGSSQSRVAKLEAGDRSVSLDLMIRSLISVGASPAQIARIIRRAEVHTAA
jgi:ribosome-binding protein aMBF1 (putative translation factor)